MLKGFITNLGKYNEGQPVGEWFDFAEGEEEFEECLKRIGIGQEYEEWFITDYDCDFDSNGLAEYCNYEQLHELAEAEEQYGDLFRAWCEVESIRHIASDLGELRDMYLLPQVHDDYDLGEYLVDEGMYCYGIRKEDRQFLNYTAIGEDYDNDNSGGQTTYGYLVRY